MSDPFVQVPEDPRCSRQSEVSLPAQRILAKLLGDLGQAPATGPARDLPDAILYPRKGLAADTGPYTPAPGCPEAESEERAVPSPVDSALGRVDLEPEVAEQADQRTHHAFPGLP